MTDDSKKSKMIKVQTRWAAILRLILDDEDGKECSTRAISKRLGEQFNIKVDHVTVWHDFNDEKFKAQIREALLSKFQTSTLIKAVRNVDKAISDGKLDPSEKVMDRVGFYPPPEMIIHSRMEAPGDTEEKALLEKLAEDNEEIKRLLELPDDPEPEPEPETES